LTPLMSNLDDANPSRVRAAAVALLKANSQAS
jgi:hypothetical protein